MLVFYFVQVETWTSNCLIREGPATWLFWDFRREDLHFHFGFQMLFFLVLCFGEFEIYFVFLCCFDLITGRHKEGDYQKENGILFWVHEYLPGILACWEFQLLGWVSSGRVRFEETRLNVHLEEYLDISQNLWEIIFFCLVWS